MEILVSGKPAAQHKNTNFYFNFFFFSEMESFFPPGGTQTREKIVKSTRRSWGTCFGVFLLHAVFVFFSKIVFGIFLPGLSGWKAAQ